MKPSIALRLLHHQKRKERKLDKGVIFPYTSEARSLLEPWEAALIRADDELTRSGKPSMPDDFYIKIVGDAKALVESKMASVTRIPVSLNEINGDVARCIITLLKRNGITL